jgi:hypothetical protein
MQNRFPTHRTCLHVSVELHRNGVKLGRFRTRDIDARAVFIEAVDCDLKLHEVIDMDFLVTRGSSRKLKRKGVIIRCAGDGLAVAFVNTDTIFFQALEESLSVGWPTAAAKRADAAADGRLSEVQYLQRHG